LERLPYFANAPLPQVQTFVYAFKGGFSIVGNSQFLF